MRFKFNDTIQSIEDTLTGEVYLGGSEEICILLNELYEPVMKLLKKYEIKDLEKLDNILFWQKKW